MSPTTEKSSSRRRPRLLYLVTEDWYFASHRLDLARSARESGYEVLVATTPGEYRRQIADEGFRLLPLRLRRGGRNPLRELISLLKVIRLYSQVRPDIVHHVALKPVLYGSLAARIVRVPAVVNAVTGLGYVFIENGRRGSFLRAIMKRSLRWALALPHSRIIFQNAEDRRHFLAQKIVRQEKSTIIRGSGVDPSRFSPLPEPEGDPVIMLPGRMLWDKGVGEFVKAARLLKERNVKARFVLVGRVDTENPAGVPESQLRSWQNEGWVEWWGHRDDMNQVLNQAHVIVLPSYREGLPKTLLEAGACGRPIVTTDVPGCREVVRDWENGFLVPPRNAEVLANAVTRLIEDPLLRKRMGERGREIVIREFSMDRIAAETLGIYRELTQNPF